MPQLPTLEEILKLAQNPPMFLGRVTRMANETQYATVEHPNGSNVRAIAIGGNITSGKVAVFLWRSGYIALGNPAQLVRRHRAGGFRSGAARVENAIASGEPSTISAWLFATDYMERFVTIISEAENVTSDTLYQRAWYYSEGDNTILLKTSTFPSHGTTGRINYPRVDAAYTPDFENSNNDPLDLGTIVNDARLIRYSDDLSIVQIMTADIDYTGAGDPPIKIANNADFQITPRLTTFYITNGSVSNTQVDVLATGVTPSYPAAYEDILQPDGTFPPSFRDTQAFLDLSEDLRDDLAPPNFPQYRKYLNFSSAGLSYFDLAHDGAIRPFFALKQTVETVGIGGTQSSPKIVKFIDEPYIPAPTTVNVEIKNEKLPSLSSIEIPSSGEAVESLTYNVVSRYPNGYGVESGPFSYTINDVLNNNFEANNSVLVHQFTKTEDSQLGDSGDVIKRFTILDYKTFVST